MNLANYHVGETSLPGVEEIQRLVKSSSRFKKPEEIDEFNRLAKVAMSHWHSSVDTYINNSDKRLKHQISFKLWHPTENVIAAGILLQHETLEIVDREAIYFTGVKESVFSNIGMLTLDDVGVAFITAGPEDGYDEALFVPNSQTHRLKVSSTVTVTI